MAEPKTNERCDRQRVIVAAKEVVTIIYRHKLTQTEGEMVFDVLPKGNMKLEEAHRRLDEMLELVKVQDAFSGQDAEFVKNLKY